MGEPILVEDVRNEREALERRVRVDAAAFAIVAHDEVRRVLGEGAELALERLGATTCEQELAFVLRPVGRDEHRDVDAAGGIVGPLGRVHEDRQRAPVAMTSLELHLGDGALHLEARASSASGGTACCRS